MEKRRKQWIDSIQCSDIQTQRSMWRSKSWSIPELRGGKHVWFSLVQELVSIIQMNPVCDFDAIPNISIVSQPQKWRTYATFLKGVGLVSNQSGILKLSSEGIQFAKEPTEINFANQLQNKTRLFGEVLLYVGLYPSTVEEIHEQLCTAYSLDWTGAGNTRRRLDWLEMLGLIQWTANRKLEITETGKMALKDWDLISPDALEGINVSKNAIQIPLPPNEIAELLHSLEIAPEKHKKRSTYNIWVPSPNRIENLRTIVQYALERVTKDELFSYIASKFNLKMSSVDSMLPFMKASGLLEEVGRGIYRATSAAKAWLDTGSDLDFVRILHAKMQFVGEMIKTAEMDSVRNDVYAEAKYYGLNTEKARWIAGFLLEAGLLEEPQYLHLKATPLGLAFIENLPLASKENLTESDVQLGDAIEILDSSAPSDRLAEIATRLEVSSCDPVAYGKMSGLAFEEAIADMFSYLGFEATHIGGSGDTDVVIRWKSDEEKSITTIIDGKSKSNGQVSHSDISDVAIDTHKDKNHADYVAIVGHGFSGDTIRNHAKKKSFALITVEQLVDVALASQDIGLSLDEIALVFQTPNGLSQLDELITSRRRELDIITTVVSRFLAEQEIVGGLSPRDMFFLLRNTKEAPSQDELIGVFETLSSSEIGILKVASKAQKAPENTIYLLNNPRQATNRMHAIATAIEKGTGA